MFKDLDKVSKAIDAAGEGGYDALNSTLGVTKKPLLGQDAVDITKLKSRSQKAAEAAEAEAKRPTDFTNLATDGTPSAPISKPSGRSVDLSGFDVGTPVSTPRSPDAPIPGPAFGQPGFAESLGIKSTPKAQEQMMSKAPMMTPNKPAKKAAPAKKAPAKEPTKPKKPTVAPKPVKKETKAVPKVKEVVKKTSIVITDAAKKILNKMEKKLLNLSTKERLAEIRKFSEDTLKMAIASFDKNSASYRDAVAELSSRK
jgi:hypothetical protein